MSYRGSKRPCEDIPSTSHETTKRHKQQCPSAETMSNERKKILRAKEIMRNFISELEDEFQNSSTENLIQYIRESIHELDKDLKKTTVGVFGKTGAGKSSLINAILGEELLPSGSLCACTSVIVQVEANVTDSNYKAEIEFISKQNWEDELEKLLKVLSDNEKDKEMVTTAKDKVTALYGEEGVSMTKEDLMKPERFSEIPEFLKPTTKSITCNNVLDFSDMIVHYVQHDALSPGGCYWPVVRSVTIKIPNCQDFLGHVVLVDLPGTGDYNKTRDQMWRLKLRDCSTVWIVSEINRACSENDAWDLLSNSVRDIAQGGECSSISFICTKTDDIIPQSYMRYAKLKDEDLHITSVDPQYTSKRETACIKYRNKTAKETVRKIFNQQDTIKKHFNCDDTFFSVFTVSSKEFTKENPILTPEDTEIPELRNLLRTFNNTGTTKTANLYISGALGILYLIEGFKNTETHMEQKSNLYEKLKINLQEADEHLQKYWMDVYNSLKKNLSNGATESERNCVENAENLIEPLYHPTLTALCNNDGYYKSKSGVVTDLNGILVTFMYKHINEQFMDFFSKKEKKTWNHPR